MHIGLLSFRIAGTDGVSLEAERWKLIFEKMGHRVTMIAGELDRKGILVPTLHFNEPLMHCIETKAVRQKVCFKKLQKKVYRLAGKIEEDLKEIFTKFKFNRLIIANALSLSLPINFSLGIALTKTINDLKIKTLSRNHDFWWERERFLEMTPCWIDFLQKYFPPPQNPLIKHIVINSLACKEFKKRTGLKSTIISDSFDFNDSFDKSLVHAKHWKKDFGIKANDIVFLQATRIVPRKQIELSIELVARLSNPKIILVLAGYSGDEGNEYFSYLKNLVKKSKIRAKFIGDRIGARNTYINNKRIYTLWDCFANCDFVTYPSRIEGFGNQFIEAVYFKKPIFINRYEVFKADIEPLGFKTITIDGKVTNNSVKQVKNILKNKKLKNSMVSANFEIGRKYFSFETVQKKLSKLGF